MINKTHSILRDSSQEDRKDKEKKRIAFVEMAVSLNFSILHL